MTNGNEINSTTQAYMNRATTATIRQFLSQSSIGNVATFNIHLGVVVHIVIACGHVDVKKILREQNRVDNTLHAYVSAIVVLRTCEGLRACPRLGVFFSIPPNMPDLSCIGQVSLASEANWFELTIQVWVHLGRLTVV